VTYFVTDYLRLKEQTSAPAQRLESITQKNTIPDRKDPFDQMDKIHDQMRKRMDQFFGRSFGNSFGNSAFDIDPFSGSSFTTNNININRYEDDQYKYIEITGEGVHKDSLKVDIAGGMISISGEIKQAQEDNNSGSMSRSSFVSKFNQSFNIPEGVDEANVEIESENKKLIIKFPIERI
jgi:HSP20 family molecular chaperone IbpA